VVAAVQGKAVGVGTTMLLHCDYVLLAEDAELIAPFINLALVPEAGSSLLMPLRIGHVRAFEMFALGEPVAARDALAWGLANKVVARDQLRAETRRMAGLLAKKPAGALALAKGLLRDTEAVLGRMERESAIFSAQLRSEEARGAFRAFAETREPDFDSIAGRWRGGSAPPGMGVGAARPAPGSPARFSGRVPVSADAPVRPDRRVPCSFPHPP